MKHYITTNVIPLEKLANLKSICATSQSPSTLSLISFLVY